MTDLVPSEEARKVGRKKRIPQLLVDAVALMITEGLSISDAANAVGYKVNSLRVALRKPHVKAYVASVKRAWLDNRTGKAWVKMAQLADSAASEDIQFKATKLFLEAAGEIGDAAGGGSAQPAQLIQIVTRSVNLNGSFDGSSNGGVIEAPRVTALPSNFTPVGNEEIEADYEDLDP